MNVLLLCLVAVAFVSADSNKADSKVCMEKCKKCPTIERSSCLAGVEKDPECNCCEECARFEGQKCDKKNATFKHGQCGYGLECKDSEGGAICQCVWTEMVCGTNGYTYPNLCQLMATAVREGLQETLEVLELGPCKKEAQIVSPPKYIKNATNEKIVLTCEAIGDPVPNMKWEVMRSNGKTVEMPGDDDRIMISTRGGPGMYKVSGWMQINGLQKRHEGDYTCIASNEHHTDRSKARIKVIN